MKCENCPLCYEEYLYEGGGDVICSVTMKPVEESCYPKGESYGCSRTDAWINSQDRHKLIENYYREECKSWEAYAKERGWVEDTG